MNYDCFVIIQTIYANIYTFPNVTFIVPQGPASITIIPVYSQQRIGIGTDVRNSLLYASRVQFTVRVYGLHVLHVVNYSNEKNSLSDRIFYGI